jgi:hypothetical protein
MFSLSLHDSEELDQHFGLNINQIEDFLFREAKKLRPEGTLSNLGHVLHDGHQTWVGLEPQVILTPYHELVQMCHHLKPGVGQHMVDLGAGYGRMGLVLHELHPGVTFAGYELVPERVNEGNRVFEERGCTNATLFTQDLTETSFELPEADFYFLYDYGKTEHIRQTLRELEKLSEKKNFKVIARGKGSRSIIEYEHVWLSGIFPSIQEENYTIYSTF